MGFHPITGWFGINNVIGWVEFNFPLVFLVGCGMDIKVIRFRYGWEWIGFFAISRPIYLSSDIQRDAPAHVGSSVQAWPKLYSGATSMSRQSPSANHVEVWSSQPRCHVEVWRANHVGGDWRQRQRRRTAGDSVRGEEDDFYLLYYKAGSKRLL
jgi:hypothetical protein